MPGTNRPLGTPLVVTVEDRRVSTSGETRSRLWGANGGKYVFLKAMPDRRWKREARGAQ